MFKGFGEIFMGKCILGATPPEDANVSVTTIENNVLHHGFTI